MKQLFICKNRPYADTSVKGTDLTSIPDGVIGLFNLSDYSRITAAVKEDFFLVVGRGTNKLPLIFPEINVKSLIVTKASYAAGNTFYAKIVVPSDVEKGKHYTVIITKKGTAFNERNNWTFTTMATDKIGSNVAKKIADQINNNKEQLGVTISYTGITIVINGVEKGKDFEVLGADALTGVVPTAITHGIKDILGREHLKDLASRCAAGKGFNYTYHDGDTIYPGYPEDQFSEQYILYTLRFAVPRMAAKQRDEVVYQTVYIAVPVNAGCITTLDTIFGLSTTSSDS